REEAFYDPSWAEFSMTFGTSYREARQIPQFSPPQLPTQVQPQFSPPRPQRATPLRSRAARRGPIRRSERIAEINRRRNERSSKTIARQRIAEYFKH
ncbi:1488_t:CDS:2, partial [Ambispora gerdemannii]